MNEQEYRELLPLLESLKELCSGISKGGKGLKDRLILGLKEDLKRHFFFIRLLITREFESGTGMNFDKWAEFADRLSEQFEEIFNAVQIAYNNYSEFEFEKTAESLTQLEQTANPFLENHNKTIEPLSKLQKWLAEAPDKIESAPPGFLGEEEKRAMTEDSLKGVGDLKKLIEALDTAKTKILTIKNFKK